MTFFSLAGPAALGTRLRQLADTLLADAEKIYQLYSIDLDPRWFPVFFMLGHKDNAAVTELAQAVRQSHPAVSQVIKQMTEAKLVTAAKCATDARISRISLTDKGRNLYEQFLVQVTDVRQAVTALFHDTGVNLWNDLDAIEHGLHQQGLFARVTDVKKQQTKQRISIVRYRPEFKNAFKALNVAWIEKHWPIEEQDLKVLDYPEENIINSGGYIAIAIEDSKVVGTAALIRMSEDCFELAKMAVAENSKRRGLGYLLGSHLMDTAKQLGAKRLYLESNTQLQPAINLYRKLGFKQISNQPSPYKRCDIQMERWL